MLFIHSGIYSFDTILYSLSKNSNKILEYNSEKYNHDISYFKIIIDVDINDINQEWINHYDNFLKKLNKKYENMFFVFLNIKNVLSSQKKQKQIFFLKMNFNYVSLFEQHDLLYAFADLKHIKKIKYNILNFHHFNIHLNSEKIFYKEFQLDIKKGKNFELFLFFIKNNNKVLSKEYIFENLWKDKYNTSNFNAIEILVGNLRKELKKYLFSDILITVQKKGYMLSYGKNKKIKYIEN